jgi:transposase
VEAERRHPCLVCASGLIPHGPSDRVKTDQRAVLWLVRLLAAHELHPGRVRPRALRDLVRAREDLGGALMSARHRVSKLVLRHAVRFEAESATGPDRTCAGSPVCASSSRHPGRL